MNDKNLEPGKLSLEFLFGVVLHAHLYNAAAAELRADKVLVLSNRLKPHYRYYYSTRQPLCRDPIFMAHPAMIARGHVASSPDEATSRVVVSA